jgi:hypothetical protein
MTDAPLLLFSHFEAVAEISKSINKIGSRINRNRLKRECECEEYSCANEVRCFKIGCFICIDVTTIYPEIFPRESSRWLQFVITSQKVDDVGKVFNERPN